MSALEVVLAIAMLAGLVGVLVPVFPGLVLVAGAGLVWALDRRGTAAWSVAIAMVLIGAAGIVLSIAVPGRRASSRGAPAWVVVSGGIGMFVGFFVVPVIGALIGFPAGVLIAELIRHRRLGPAWTATLDAMKGVALGIMVQLAAGVAMIGLWLVAVLVM